jgi:predicted pyridoxine 5'-phosphate oxidase superfamily flavin-nucleotide-binding protein
VIEPEVAALLETGVSLIVCTVDAQGMPDANRAWSTKVLDGGARLRITISDDSHGLIDNLHATGRLAITYTEIEVLTSYQVKGRMTSEIGPESGDDAARRAAYIEAFCANVKHVNGTPRELLDRLMPSSFLVFEMDVDEVFDQTPGPSAGRQLAPVPS